MLKMLWAKHLKSPRHNQIYCRTSSSHGERRHRDGPMFNSSWLGWWNLPELYEEDGMIELSMADVANGRFAVVQLLQVQDLFM